MINAIWVCQPRIVFGEKKPQKYPSLLHNGSNNRFSVIINYIVAVVVERLACLPVTQKIGVRFYLERESSAVGSLTVTCRYCVRVLPVYCELYDTLY